MSLKKMIRNIRKKAGYRIGEAPSPPPPPAPVGS